MTTNGGYIRDEELADDCRETFSRDWGVAFPFFKGWNEAMAMWLSHVKVERPEEPLDVPVLYQTPERAFAEIAAPTVNDQVALPIISFTMSGAQFDKERFFGGHNLTWERYRVGNTWEKVKKPMPWELNYMVTIWTKFQLDMDTIIYRLISRFTPSSYLRAFGTPALLELVSHTDTSILEPGEATDRVLRNDLSFKANAWLPLPPLSVGQIEGVDVLLDNKLGRGDVNFDLSQDINIVEGEFSVETGTAGYPEKSPQVIVTEE